MNLRVWATRLGIAIVAGTATVAPWCIGWPWGVGLVLGGLVLGVVSIRGGLLNIMSAAIGVGLGLALPYVLVFALLDAPMVLDNFRHRASFDAESWRANAKDDPMWPARLTMVDDLLRSRQFHGMSRDEVEVLLGPPDETPYFRDWSMVYWLGPERSWLRIDSEWLVLRLDDSGRVTEYRLARD